MSAEKVKNTSAKSPYITYWPLILPSVASPATVFFLRQYILSVMPKAILEAPRIDVASELAIFHRIVLPITAPGIATMAIGGGPAGQRRFHRQAGSDGGEDRPGAVLLYDLSAHGYGRHPAPALQPGPGQRLHRRGRPPKCRWRPLRASGAWAEWLDGDNDRQKLPAPR